MISSNWDRIQDNSCFPVIQRSDEKVAESGTSFLLGNLQITRCSARNLTVCWRSNEPREIYDLEERGFLNGGRGEPLGDSATARLF